MGAWRHAQRLGMCAQAAQLLCAPIAWCIIIVRAARSNMGDHQPIHRWTLRALTVGASGRRGLAWLPAGPSANAPGQCPGPAALARRPASSCCPKGRSRASCSKVVRHRASRGSEAGASGAARQQRTLIAHGTSERQLEHGFTGAWAGPSTPCQGAMARNGGCSERLRSADHGRASATCAQAHAPSAIAHRRLWGHMTQFRPLPRQSPAPPGPTRDQWP